MKNSASLIIKRFLCLPGTNRQQYNRQTTATKKTSVTAVCQSVILIIGIGICPEFNNSLHPNKQNSVRTVGSVLFCPHISPGSNKQLLCTCSTSVGLYKGLFEFNSKSSRVSFDLTKGKKNVPLSEITELCERPILLQIITEVPR